MPICINCGNKFTGKYCNACGEKIYSEKDKTIKHLIHEGLHFLTHFEGTFFNTLKVIFFNPGKLSLDYCSGIRKKYFKPLSFFLMLIIIYLIFPVFEGLNMNLRFHKLHFLYGGYASQKVAEILNNRNITELQLSESFHHVGGKISKFLLFIIIPITACFSFLAGWKKHRPYYDHFVYTIEVCSFYILWSFLLLPFLSILSKKVTGYGIASETMAIMVSQAVFLPFVIFSAKRFFNFKWWYSILYALLFTLSLIFVIEYIYKLILFLIVIHWV